MSSRIIEAVESYTLTEKSRVLFDSLTHTSNLEKIINIYKRGKGNIILSSDYYDTG